MEMDAVLLAGGKSSRMGRDKALLPFAGTTLAAWVIGRIRPAVAAVIVVAPDPRPFAGYGVRVVPDLFPGRGPLGGLHAGLAASRAAAGLAVACDMPLVSPDLARHLRLALEATGAEAAVPLWRRGAEPLFAVYRRSAVRAAEAELHAGSGRLTDFLTRLRVRWVPEAELAAFGNPEELFMNVNHPEELERARAAAASLPRF